MIKLRELSPGMQVKLVDYLPERCTVSYPQKMLDRLGTVVTVMDTVRNTGSARVPTFRIKEDPIFYWGLESVQYVMDNYDESDFDNIEDISMLFGQVLRVDVGK